MKNMLVQPTYFGAPAQCIAYCGAHAFEQSRCRPTGGKSKRFTDTLRIGSTKTSQPDLIIAATALNHGLTVVSRDEADYARAGVPLFNRGLMLPRQPETSTLSRNCRAGAFTQVASLEGQSCAIRKGGSLACWGAENGASEDDSWARASVGIQEHERMGAAAQVLALRGDGLSGMQQQGIDAVVIAGMSGDSMLRILEAAPQVLAPVQQLVLQPNHDVHQLRAWALHNGWHLRDEQMIEERGQFFVVCAFAPGGGEDPAYSVTGWTKETLCNLGPRLLARKDAVALRWFERQRTRVSRWVQRDIHRLQPELDVWDAACKAMRPA